MPEPPAGRDAPGARRARGQAMLRAEKRAETSGNRFPTRQILLGSSFQHFLSTAAALLGQRAAFPQGAGRIPQKPQELTRKGHSAGPRPLSPPRRSFHGHIWTEMRLFPERASRQNRSGSCRQSSGPGKKKKKLDSEPDRSFFKGIQRSQLKNKSGLPLPWQAGRT